MLIDVIFCKALEVLSGQSDDKIKPSAEIAWKVIPIAPAKGFKRHLMIRLILSAHLFQLRIANLERTSHDRAQVGSYW